MRLIDKLRGGLAAAAGGTACAALFVMMVVAVVDVVLRTVFNKPLAAASELIELAMVATIFLVYPLVSWKGLHISIDLLDSWMPDVARRIQHVLAALLGAAVFTAVAWRVGFLAREAWASNEVTGVLGVPLGHVYAFICGFSGVTSLTFLALVPRAFARGPFRHATLAIDEVPE
ncbi:TRAP transporter small permease [Ramlibacter sp.]|uniref:TRAP transporter small permease n=1 Tax=Ramlibacter sp. TaxID=1917967 RepID=UPI0035B427E6